MCALTVFSQPGTLVVSSTMTSICERHLDNLDRKARFVRTSMMSVASVFWLVEQTQDSSDADDLSRKWALGCLS